MLKKILIIFISTIFLLGNDNLTLLIKEYKKASPSEKYILMNRIKKELIKLNIQKRIEAIEKLKKRLSFPHGAGMRRFKKKDFKRIKYNREKINKDCKNKFKHRSRRRR